MENMIFDAFTNIDEELITEAYEYNFWEKMCVKGNFFGKPAYTIVVLIWLVGSILSVQSYFGGI